VKKKHAVVFFGFITVSALAYAVWCGRAMFFHAAPPAFPGMPGNFHAEANALVSKHGLTQPWTFHRTIYFFYLCNPYKSSSNELRVMAPPGGDRITVARYPGLMPNIDTIIEFRNWSGTWTATVTSEQDPSRNEVCVLKGR